LVLSCDWGKQFYFFVSSPFLLQWSRKGAAAHIGSKRTVVFVSSRTAMPVLLFIIIIIIY
jgi:hypothetical protein